MMPYHPNFKDTRWLTLEVCREFQRNKCNRTENECKFAHPQPHVEVLNGKVIACYDSLKGKCSRREPPCKYLHPPQHLKDQLLQNGKNNLVLKQVALAMMHQQHHQQQVPQQAAQHHQNAMLAAASPTQFHTSYHGAPGASALYNQMANGSIQPLIQVTSANGQQTLVPLMTNGFHPSGLSLQSHANAIYATDPTTLIQHVQAPNLASQNTILPHQRTDRLTQYQAQLNAAFISNHNIDDQLNGTAYAIDNNAAYQIPHGYQLISAPAIYSTRQQNANAAQANGHASNASQNQVSSSIDENQGSNDGSNAAASSSATANATANVVDVVVPSKKRQHDTTEDLIPLQGNIYGSHLPIKRAALIDNKTGMPVYQPYHSQYANLAQQQAIAAYQANGAAYAMQYAQYPPGAYSLQYNGHPTGVPRL